MDELKPIEQRDIKPDNVEQPVVVICCGGSGVDPADPYADVMAGVRFDGEDTIGTLAARSGEQPAVSRRS